MNKNSDAVFAMCSRLCLEGGALPLEPKEWGEMEGRLMGKGMEPADLFDFSRVDLKADIGLSEGETVRVLRLIDRFTSLSMVLGKYESMGIFAITRADVEYPIKLKRTLKDGCPPIFYFAGDISLLNHQVIGYVGSRNAAEDDTVFAKKTVGKTFAEGFDVVSGGARGVDTASEQAVLALGGNAIAYLSESLLQRLKREEALRAVRNGHLLLMSIANPDADFTASVAMMRNRYIYIQSEATVVVRADYNKGGTWAGATDNLKHGWCPLLCRAKASYDGNTALIKKGAIPIDEAWDGNPSSIQPNKPSFEQMSLFDII